MGKVEYITICGEDEFNPFERVYFKPKLDITTYELALCVSVLIASPNHRVSRSELDRLPQEARRHFQGKDDG